MRLTAALEELEKLNRNAQQAVLMADEASRTGDAAKAAAYTNAAEAFANQLIAKEKEVENLKTMSLQSTQASEQAKSAVQQNSRVLQQKLVREAEAPVAARPGEDAGADEHGDVEPDRAGRRGRADPRRGAREDRVALRQGEGHGRAPGT